MQESLSRIFQTMLGLLEGPDYELRRRSLMALSRLRGDMAADIIFERYRSDNLEDYLVLAVSRMDPRKSTPILIAALSDMHLEARLTAAEALVKQRSEESVAALLATVEAYLKQDPGGRKENLVSEEALQGIARALGEIATPMCLGLLRKLILQEKNERVRATVVGVLGQHINDSMVPMFQGLLKDADPRVRSNAIESLANLQKPTIIGLLQPYLFDPHPRVKANAAKAIWKFGDFDVSATLKEMLTGADKKLRVSGIYAVGEIRLEAFQKTILGFLADPDPDVRRNCVVALRKFQQKQGASALAPLLADPVPEVRQQVAISLGEVLQEEAVPILLKRLGVEPAANIRSHLASIIGKFGKPEHFASLLPLLQDDDERVVGNVIEALQKMKPKEPHAAAVASLRRFLDSSNNRIRANSIRFLWEWGFTDVLDALHGLIASGNPEKVTSGLFCLGEVFSSVSHQGGNLLQTFDSIMKSAVEAKRRQFADKGGGIGDAKVRALWEKTQEALKANRLPEARQGLEAILQAAPRLHPALVALGELTFREGALAEAEVLFQRALAVSPNILKAHYSLGQIYHRQRNWARAIHALQMTIRLYPKLPQAYLILADSLEAENRWKEAAETLKRLAALVPKNPQVMQRQARATFLSGAVGEAIPLARAAAAVGQIDAFTTLILGVGEYFGGHPEKALATILAVMGVLTEKPDPRALADANRLIKVFQGLLARKEPSVPR
ncbi:MAG: tetratricopeptide repeat protein [Candidatus Riflebacteria bacterium]|nr:tetratricopeptide repeat protein [Candidatus Riflebacteria bacterium]